MAKDCLLSAAHVVIWARCVAVPGQQASGQLDQAEHPRGPDPCRSLR